ncbi:porin family protein, partial [Geobacter sp. AOG2]|uniref:porin family protein n=1 Tax=Geobacter sp. AOG2 TaxID=1566347 RepID=UPI001CC42099
CFLKRVYAFAAISFLVLVFSGTVFGAVSEGQFSISPMIGGYTYDGGQHLETAPMYSLKGGYNLTDNIGVEAGLDYSITSSKLVTDKNVAIFKYGVEGLYHFMPDKQLVPFVAFGLGGYNMSGPSALVSRKVMGFVDYGAGVKYFLYDRLALRADVRHVVANASAFEYTLGVTIPFGGVKAVPQPVVTFAEVKAALAKMRQEQTETSQAASRETHVEEKPVQNKVPLERPMLPTVVAPEQNRTKELSSSEKLAQLKEQFAKEELERITTFKAEWEKGKEARLAAEKAARAQETLNQAKIWNERSAKKERNSSLETAKQTEKPLPAKSTRKSRHKHAAKKKPYIPKTPRRASSHRQISRHALPKRIR